MPQQLNVADLRLTSPAFRHHERIPSKHAGDGEDVAPELSWTGAPEGTAAFAIVMHDPDAPLVDGFTHWVAYGIAGDASGLPEGGGNATSGVNSMARPATTGRRRHPVTGPTTTTSGSTRSIRIWSFPPARTAARYSTGSRTT